MADSKKKVNVVADMRALNESELAAKIADLQKELVEQHRSNKANELPSAAVIKKTRRTIATAKTLLKERVIEAAMQATSTKPDTQKEQEK